MAQAFRTTPRRGFLKLVAGATVASTLPAVAGSGSDGTDAEIIRLSALWWSAFRKFCQLAESSDDDEAVAAMIGEYGRHYAQLMAIEPATTGGLIAQLEIERELILLDNEWKPEKCGPEFVVIDRAVSLLRAA